jgi:hypothetical protein
VTNSSSLPGFAVNTTLSRCNLAGLNALKFPKYANNDNVGCTRTSATSNSHKIPRKCSPARVPPVEP